jgi:hypothetical protein
MSRIGSSMNYFGRLEELDLDEKSIRPSHRGEELSLLDDGIHHFFLASIIRVYECCSQVHCFLTHCGRVTEIYVFTFQPCKTGDVNLRF